MTGKNRGTVTAGDRIRVLIVDDHALVRSGLRFFLLAFDDLELVGEADSGEGALALCAQVRPDVVMMDLMMPGMSGATATQVIRERWPKIQVVALTNFQDAEIVRGALQAGAAGYLLKNVSAEDLADAIRAAHAGQPTLAPEATAALIHAATDAPTRGHDLTPREWEVLTLLVEGLSNAEIGERLVISLSTVKFHVSNVLSKLGVGSRAEAVALTLQHNLVPKPGADQVF